ncbi:ATP-dependent sacrificial sulfur transferase LarE [bacterium]|nr:ATP-dependent sacrificial sulfur transferase LarE [candidate division CSSED10-310 bacterium]
MISAGLQEKHRNLKGILQPLDGCLVAFSGGVDSSTLLAECLAVHRSRAAAIIAQSPALPKDDYLSACQLASQLGATLKTVQTQELHQDNFTQNAPDRCYICKKHMYQLFIAEAKAMGFPHVLDGSNADDERDYRPGFQAVKELGIRSPLMEAGMTKSDVRALAKQMGLPNWNKPAAACLYSRIPYGQKITPAKTRRIDAAETFLHRLGFDTVRVRDHGSIASIEINPDQFADIMSKSTLSQIINSLKNLGYLYITLDLEGYRTGSLNVTITNPDEEK